MTPRFSAWVLVLLPACKWCTEPDSVLEVVEVPVLPGVVRVPKPGTWPDATVPYVIDPDVDPGARERLIDAMARWTARTGGVFRPAVADDRDFVRFENGRTCRSSDVGFAGGEQFVEVEKTCRREELLHELGHVWGMRHEHQRQDRDEHLEVHLENVEPGYADRFSLEALVASTPYDCWSIMHYSETALLARGTTSPDARTMVPRDRSACPCIGKAMDLSNGDVDRWNDLYVAPAVRVTAPGPVETVCW